jgi:hypothetical protein
MEDARVWSWDEDERVRVEVALFNAVRQKPMYSAERAMT